MKAILAEVLEYIARCSDGLFRRRNEPLYDALLQLYESVGYASKDTSERTVEGTRWIIDKHLRFEMPLEETKLKRRSPIP
jgi:hypothetical protein